MWRVGRFTVDDLGVLPDWGLRAEVLDGRLLLAPPASRRHDRVVHNLVTRVRPALPGGVRVRTGQPVRLSDGDGPVPDLVVVAGEDAVAAGPVPVAGVHTVLEVVCADGRFLDRVWKRDRYGEAGVPCYWRVELAPWPGYRGPGPVIVARVREPGGWREVVAAPGRVAAVPLAYGRGRGGVAFTVPVRLDPGALLVRQASTR
jgi:Uma2 family endonuclease